MRHTALLLVVLTLVACDSSAPGTGSPPDALVGRWSLDRYESELYVTSVTTQTFVDLSGTATGQVSVTGSETATIRFLNPSLTDVRAGTVRLTSRNPDGSGPATTYDLHLHASDTGVHVAQLQVSAPGRSEAYDLRSGPLPFSFSGGRIRVPPMTLTASDGRQVQVNGELIVPTVSLPAGQRTRMHVQTVPFVPGSYGGGPPTRYAFEADGSYRAERDLYEDVTNVFVGFWSTDGNRLRLSPTLDGTVNPETFAYAVSGGTLRLSIVATSCSLSPDCLQSFEYSMGLQPGSLSALESVESTVFLPRPWTDAPRGGATLGSGRNALIG